MTTDHDQPAGDRPLIILVSSGYHLWREYLLDQVARAARVWLFLAGEPTWELRYVAGHTVVDTLDAAAMIAAARELAGREAVSGVLCWDEVRMVPASEVARALGLPGGETDAIGRCRDKHLTRVALDAAGVPQPRSVLAASLEEARAAAGRIGYPVVLKPRALGASFGVCGVESAAGLDAGYAEARGATEDGVPYYEAGVLVEEYLSGEEISVDSACVDGRLAPMFVARKLSGFPPYFEEVGHVVRADDPLLHDQGLLDLLQRAHQAVGFHTGITHTEVRLTADGPKIIEINCRLGGDLIPYVASVASGIDAGLIAVEVCCGRQATIARRRSRVASVNFCYPERDCTVEHIAVDEAALPESIDAVGVVARPGQQLLLPPAGHVTSRYAYVVAAGDSAQDCQDAFHVAAKAITLHAR